MYYTGQLTVQGQVQTSIISGEVVANQIQKSLQKMKSLFDNLSHEISRLTTRRYSTSFL